MFKNIYKLVLDSKWLTLPLSKKNLKYYFRLNINKATKAIVIVQICQYLKEFPTMRFPCTVSSVSFLAICFWIHHKFEINLKRMWLYIWIEVHLMWKYFGPRRRKVFAKQLRKFQGSSYLFEFGGFISGAKTILLEMKTRHSQSINEKFLEINRIQTAFAVRSYNLRLLEQL